MWLINGEAVISPVFPWVIRGTDLAFTMTLVNDSGSMWANTYLFVDSGHVGRLQAKISSETTYSTLGVLGDVSFYIGRLNAGESVEIKFILSSLSSDSGCGIFYLPIYVGHDAGATSAYRLFFSEYERLWIQCYGQTPLFFDSYVYPNNACGVADIPDGAWDSDLTPLWSDELTPVWRDS